MSGGFENLVGRRIRRVDAPEGDLVALTLGGRDGQEVLVASLPPSERAIALVAERPKGKPASSFVRKLRKEIGGAVIEALDAAPGALLLRCARGGDRRAVVLDLDGPGNVLLLDADERIVVALRPAALRERGLSLREPWTPAPGARAPVPASAEALRRAGAGLIGDRRTRDVEQRRRALDRALRNALRRLDRRLDAIAGDAARARDVGRLRQRAQALLSALHAIPPDATEVTVTDWYADPPAPLVLPIDPKLGAKGTVDALFHRARRLERGAKIAEGRLAETQSERRTLEELRQRVRGAAGVEALRELAEQARRAGVRGAIEAVDPSERPGKARQAGRVPYRRFVGHADRPILVGRGAADNDALTLHVAKPSDLWLHARGQRGAHVIVPLAENESCPPELLVDAAHLAAHFSEARGEPIVEIQHCPRRHVRKPKGSPPGAVLVDRERVFPLRVEPARLERLLRSETEP